MKKRTRVSTSRTNRGWFKVGLDPRRHLLTAEERLRGGLTAWSRRNFVETDPVHALVWGRLTKVLEPV